ncbi:Maf family protein [Rheinheimera sp. WS51]|uniref:Maf family protein n=1 Tax=Rheinheimera sp. WS51 TaxID=3425886 RepID=UPI003D8BDCB3
MTQTTTAKLWLASSSEYRKAILSKLTKNFNSQAPNVDETVHPHELASTLVSRLALAKAQAVASSLTEGLVIGSDQVALFQGAIIGKPHSFDKAIAQLRRFSGHKVQFLTGLAVVNAADNSIQQHIDYFDVWFRSLTDVEIVRYVEKEQPLDCAGSFKVEGLGISLFEKLIGDDPNSLVGLPLLKLNHMLINAGYNVLLEDEPT